MKLHQEFVGGAAAVHPEQRYLQPGFGAHRLDDITRLVGDSFQGSSCQVPFFSAAGNAEYCSPGIHIPVRGAQSGKGGDEVNAAVIGYGACQRLALGGAGYYFQAVPQPLDSGSGDEDASLHCVAYFIIQSPGKGGDQPFLRTDRLVAGIEQDKRACPVGVFRHSGLIARLAEEGCLLVACYAADGYRGIAEESGCGLAVNPAGGHHCGKDRLRNIQLSHKLPVPLEGVDIEQHRPAGVAVVGDMDGAAGEVPDQPAVHRAEEELALLGALLALRDVIEEPAELGGGKVSVDNQPGLLHYRPAQASLLQFLA